MAIFKYLGLAMLMAAALLLSREYEKNQRKRMREFSEFIRLAEHIKTKISCFLSPKSDWLPGFSASEGGVVEFLRKASHSSLSDSFSAVRDKLSLGEEAEILARLFLSLGASYKEGEIELLNKNLSELEAAREKLFSECEKNVKTVRVLLSAASLGLIILLI